MLGSPERLQEKTFQHHVKSAPPQSLPERGAVETVMVMSVVPKQPRARHSICPFQGPLTGMKDIRINFIVLISHPFKTRLS